VFSVEGLINEYVELARILRKGNLTTIDPLTEPEDFHIAGFSPLVAFHTSGGTSTLPETFEGRVGECFEKTLRYPGHYDLLCELKELGLFSSEKMKFGKAEISPRAMMSKIFEGKFASKGPDVCIMRLEAHESVNRAGVRGLLGGRPFRHRSWCRCWLRVQSASGAGCCRSWTFRQICSWEKSKSGESGSSTRWSEGRKKPHS